MTTLGTEAIVFFGSVIALLSLFCAKMSSIFSKKYDENPCFFHSGPGKLLILF